MWSPGRSILDTHTLYPERLQVPLGRLLFLQQLLVQLGTLQSRSQILQPSLITMGDF